MECYIYPIMERFVTSLLAGLTSAAVVLIVRAVCARIYERERFGSVEGKYDECNMPTKAPTGGVVGLTYLGGNAVGSEARNRDGHVVWTGTINMDEAIPYLGKGVYQYKGKDDCGTHTIQQNKETRNILVWGSNTSHPQGVREFYMFWRRKDVEGESGPAC